jgi:hypothetical protein
MEIYEIKWVSTTVHWSFLMQAEKRFDGRWTFMASSVETGDDYMTIYLLGQAESDQVRNTAIMSRWE